MIDLLKLPNVKQELTDPLRCHYANELHSALKQGAYAWQDIRSSYLSEEVQGSSSGNYGYRYGSGSTIKHNYKTTGHVLKVKVNRKWLPNQTLSSKALLTLDAVGYKRARVLLVEPKLCCESCAFFFEPSKVHKVNCVGEICAFKKYLRANEPPLQNDNQRYYARNKDAARAKVAFTLLAQSSIRVA